LYWWIVVPQHSASIPLFVSIIWRLPFTKNGSCGLLNWRDNLFYNYISRHFFLIGARVFKRQGRYETMTFQFVELSSPLDNRFVTCCEHGEQRKHGSSYGGEFTLMMTLKTLLLKRTGWVVHVQCVELVLVTHAVVLLSPTVSASAVFVCIPCRVGHFRSFRL
jgi:hypothetical protein